MRPPLRIASLAATALSVPGCLVHQPDTQPQPMVPVAGPYTEASASAEPASAVIPAAWWQFFQDPTLTALLEEALSSNLELAQLASRIEQADALFRQAGGQLYPQLDGVADFDSRWTDLEDSADRRRDDSASVGALLTWELDVWGRLRSARNARQSERQAFYFDWLGGRLMLSAAVVETYYAILEQKQQLGLLARQIEINQTLLDLTRLRFGQGQSSIVDVLQQREQLASTRARVPSVEARLRQLEYALDVLRGRPPRESQALPVRNLPAPPRLPEPGLPSELLDRRPDLLASRQRIVAVDYTVGEAVADRLPRFVIGGSLSAVGDPGINSLIANAFAAAAGPLFDAGIRRFEVDLRKARLRESLAAYSEAYLAAVSEVETALIAERKQSETVALLEDQLQIAQQLLLETRNRYSQGLTDYLPVLAAVVTEQNLQRDLVTSRRELLSSRVAFHRALGGPMDPAGTDPFLTP